MICENMSAKYRFTVIRVGMVTMIVFSLIFYQSIILKLGHGYTC